MILDLIRQNSDALTEIAACLVFLGGVIILIVREARK